MQAAKHAAIRDGHVVLHEFGIHTRLGVTPGVKHFAERAAGIAMNVRLHESQARDLELGYLHGSHSPRNRPTK